MFGRELTLQDILGMSIISSLRITGVSEGGKMVLCLYSCLILMVEWFWVGGWREGDVGMAALLRYE